MTKFETIGIDFQKESGSKSEAAYRMSVSCDICSKKGMVIKGGCSGCSIRAAHNMVMEAFSFSEQWKAAKEAAAAKEVKE